MLFIVSILVVAFIALNNIVHRCNTDPRQGSLDVALGSYLAYSSDHGTNSDPSDTKGQMKFHQSTCLYSKIVLGLPLNTHYEWKVAFNGHWGGDKGCDDNDNNCPFKSSSSGAVLLMYNPYNDQLMSTTISSNTTTTASTSTTTVPFHRSDGKCVPPKTHKTCPQDFPAVLLECQIFPSESCLSSDQFHANQGVGAKRWQAPKPVTTGYQPSYQHYYTPVGYADIIYIHFWNDHSDKGGGNRCM